MKLLSFLLVKYHFIGLLASPVSQQNDEYYYEEYETSPSGSSPEYDQSVDDYVKDYVDDYDYDYQDVGKMCILPPELDNVGEDLSGFIKCCKVLKLIEVVMFDFLGTKMPIFECKTLHRFDKPPCNINNFDGNHIDVSIY